MLKQLFLPMRKTDYWEKIVKNLFFQWKIRKKGDVMWEFLDTLNMDYQALHREWVVPKLLKVKV